MRLFNSIENILSRHSLTKQSSKHWFIMKTNTSMQALHIGFFSKQANVGAVKYQTKTRSLLHLGTIFLPSQTQRLFSSYPRGREFRPYRQPLFWHFPATFHPCKTVDLFSFIYFNTDWEIQLKRRFSKDNEVNYKLLIIICKKVKR
jgi:hypothetical protein